MLKCSRSRSKLLSFRLELQPHQQLKPEPHYQRARACVTRTERPSSPSVAFSTGKPGAYVHCCIHRPTSCPLACTSHKRSPSHHKLSRASQRGTRGRIGTPILYLCSPPRTSMNSERSTLQVQAVAGVNKTVPACAWPQVTTDRHNGEHRFKNRTHLCQCSPQLLCSHCAVLVGAQIVMQPLQEHVIGGRAQFCCIRLAHTRSCSQRIGTPRGMQAT